MIKLVYVVKKGTSVGINGYACAFSTNGKYLAVGSPIFLLDFERIKQKIESAGVKEKAEPLTATIVYPNPTQDVIQVRFTLEDPCQQR